MKKFTGFYVLVFIGLLVLAALACGGADDLARPQETLAPLDSIALGSNLSQVDVCAAVPQETIEAVMGRKLVSTPERFEYYDASGTSGCAYDAGKDADGEAHFGYVVLTPVEVYANQPLYMDTAVEGLGAEAYFNNGADARQLWVKLDEQTAFVVAFGDIANEAGALSLARLLVDAIGK